MEDRFNEEYKENAEERRKRIRRLAERRKQRFKKEREEKIANGTWEYWRDYVLDEIHWFVVDNDVITQTEGGYKVAYWMIIKYTEETNETWCYAYRAILEENGSCYKAYIINRYFVRKKRGTPNKRTLEKAWFMFDCMYSSELKRNRECENIMETIDDYDG